MRNKHRPSRNDHTGKSGLEKSAYRKFLSRPSSRDFDKTLEDDLDPSNTDISRVVEIDSKESSRPSIRTSLKYKISDWFLRNLAITIVGGIIVGVILIFANLLVGNNRELGETKIQISGLSDRVGTIEAKYNTDTSNSAFNELNTSFQVFKATILGQVNFIKDQINEIHRRLP